MTLSALVNREFCNMQWCTPINPPNNTAQESISLGRCCFFISLSFENSPSWFGIIASSTIRTSRRSDYGNLYQYHQRTKSNRFTCWSMQSLTRGVIVMNIKKIRKLTQARKRQFICHNALINCDNKQTKWSKESYNGIIQITGWSFPNHCRSRWSS